MSLLVLAHTEAIIMIRTVQNIFLMCVSDTCGTVIVPFGCSVIVLLNRESDIMPFVDDSAGSMLAPHKYRGQAVSL